jgi:hypothetical protein
LPCCGKTVCYVFVQNIKEQLKDQKFRCIACNKEETMPNNEFLVNNVVKNLVNNVKLLAKQPKEISRGEQAEKLITLVKTLYKINTTKHKKT